MSRLYTFLQIEEQRYLSLNFLFSEEIKIDFSSFIFKGVGEKSESIHHNSRDYQSILFHKHVSRYIENIDFYPTDRYE